MTSYEAARILRNSAFMLENIIKSMPSEQEIEFKQAYEMAISKLRDYDFHADWQTDIEPDEEGLYFITWEGTFGSIGGRWIEMAEYRRNQDSGEYSWDVSHIENRGNTNVKVLAWMDLPNRWEG